jgi:CO/xanthine dehydrogenase FAD-binding subunit
MRSYPADYELISPGSLKAVLELLSEEPGQWTPIAGGTEIMVQFGAGRLAPHKLVNIWNLAELREIVETEFTLSIGGGCTFSQIRSHAGVQQHFPMLAKCASWTGGIANQNRGTLAGNLANASPAADSPPALIAYDAEIEFISARGLRLLPYDQFHLGYKKTALGADELIYALHLRKKFAGCLGYVRKVGPRNAQAISKICIAATASLREGVVKEICIGMGSVAPAPLRLAGTERALTGNPIDEAAIAAARRALQEEIAPIDDIRSTAEYRRLVAANLVEDMLRSFASTEASR